eukprot:6466438-Amphidinium_carterae.2
MDVTVRDSLCLMLVGSHISFSTLGQFVLQATTLVCVWRQHNKEPEVPLTTPTCEVEELPRLELRVSIVIGVQLGTIALLVLVLCCCNRSHTTRVPRTVYRSSLASADGSRRSSVREI